MSLGHEEGPVTDDVAHGEPRARPSAPRAPPRVGLVTSEGWPLLSADDRRLPPELARGGLTAVPVVWSDPAVDWASFAALVLRSTWDYHLRFEAFTGWLRRLRSAGAPLWNPPDTALWNADKRYLADLEAAGVPVVPTAWVEGGAAVPDALRRRGWPEAVVKPTRSATAWRTLRVRAGDDAPALGGPLMVQPFLPAIASDGEWSLVFVDGAYSHAVRKRPAAGDFRVQEDFGGSTVAAPAPSSLVAAAERALAAVPGPWLYARVDGVRDGAGLLLMELELLEPSLFLGHAPKAAARLARAIARVAGVGSG